MDSSKKLDENLDMNDERLKIWLGFAKFILGTVILGAVSVAINSKIQMREISLQEQKQLSTFTADALNPNVTQRYLLANFFATVTQNTALKKGWQDYFEITKIEYDKLKVQEKETSKREKDLKDKLKKDQAKLKQVQTASEKLQKSFEKKETSLKDKKISKKKQQELKNELEKVKADLLIAQDEKIKKQKIIANLAKELSKESSKLIKLKSELELPNKGIAAINRLEFSNSNNAIFTGKNIISGKRVFIHHRPVNSDIAHNFASLLRNLGANVVIQGNLQNYTQGADFKVHNTYSANNPNLGNSIKNLLTISGIKVAFSQPAPDGNNMGGYDSWLSFGPNG